MDHGTKNRLLTGLVIVLVIVNAATLVFFWMGRPKHPLQPKGTPREFLVKELKLDSNQQKQYDVLVKAHHEAADQLREKIKASKESFFDLLKQANVPDSVKQAAAKAVSANTEELDLLTLNHFQKLRSLCTIDQQKKFDEIIQQVVGMIAQPRPTGIPGVRGIGPQGPPPPGEPGGDRPPAPGN